jgi:hypothetical protein
MMVRRFTDLFEVFDVGHSVSTYQPPVAFQAFNVQRSTSHLASKYFHFTHDFAKRTVHTGIVVDDFIGSFCRRAITS